jgi:MoaA/NifB/PqqE/SkfB family radical SAM enzyme
MALLSTLKQAIVDGGPGFCQFAITNLCNARCEFCNFAVDRMPVDQRASVTLAQAQRALEILRRQGVGYIVFVGGEPFAHPDLRAMVRHAASLGMAPMICTNGSLLTPENLDGLKQDGLSSIIISIDAPSVEAHEKNRCLKNVCERIRQANAQLDRLKIQSTASVTISRLIQDYGELPAFLRSLGFRAVTFSYPLTSLASSYLGFADSNLVDFRPEELLAIFDRVKALKKEFHVLNPTASLSEMQRHLRGEPELFECLGGYKYFYLDWHLQLYRCHNWDKPMCHVDEFDGSQLVRDGCTACMMDCYRDSSVLQHVAVSVSDSLQAVRKGRMGEAARALFNRPNLTSLQSVLENARWIARM